MYRYTLTVPKFDNDGFETDLEDVEATLTDIAAGYTRLDGVGGWFGDLGQTYREDVAVYVVDSGGETWTLLRALARLIANRYDQEAVYLTRQEIDTWLVRKDEV